MRLKEYPKVGEQAWYETLPNGLRIVAVKKPGFRKSTAFLAVDYGAAERRFMLGGDWTDTPMGVAHFLEHKMFDMPGGENAMNIFAQRGAQSNAFTASDMTAYYFECIDDFEKNLELLLRFVTTPYFTEESVNKERGIIGQEIKMTEDDPDNVLYYSLLRSLYAKNPVRDPIVGTVESIGEITADTLYMCHKAFYIPSNMTLVVVGDEDPKKICETASSALSDAYVLRPTVDYGPKDGDGPAEKRMTHNMDVGTPMFAAGIKTTPGLRGQDAVRAFYVGNLAMSTMMGRASKFYNEMYSEGIINDTFTFNQDRSAGIAYLDFGGETNVPDKVFDRVMAEAKRFVKDPDTELFERRRKAIYGSALRGLNSFDSICYNVASAEFEGYDYFKVTDIIVDISVDDAVAFIEKYFKPELAAISLISRQEG